MPSQPTTDPLIKTITLNDHEFDLLRELIHKHFGIYLKDEKRSLVNGRLQKVVREKGFKSFKEYYLYLTQTKDATAMSQLANSMATNHTFFNRESEHFDFFSKVVLPEITYHPNKQTRKQFRMWCAASSTGEEPYTLAMLMMEHWKTEYSKWDAGLLATDISEKALSKAISGTYSEEEVESLSQNLKKKYFDKNSGNDYTVSEAVKREVTFRRFNLMNQFPFKQPFDVIFIRNVMIYFDLPTKKELVQKLIQFTNIGGYIFIGHAETLGHKFKELKYVQPAVYKKV